MKTMIVLTISFLAFSRVLASPPVAVPDVVEAIHVPGVLESGPLIYYVIAPDAVSATVTLDGSASYDLDGDALEMAWVEVTSGDNGPLGRVFATGPRTTNVFYVANSSYNLRLNVSDGTSIGSRSFILAVYSPAEAAETLREVIFDATRSGAQRSLLAMVQAAIDSFDEGRFERGVHYLRLFQKKLSQEKIDLPRERVDGLRELSEIIIRTVSP
jgi:hypothetical protein